VNNDDREARAIPFGPLPLPSAHFVLVPAPADAPVGGEHWCVCGEEVAVSVRLAAALAVDREAARQARISLVHQPRQLREMIVFARAAQSI
jgi:hypothetical protein